jgi:hypothetical protein
MTAEPSPNGLCEGLEMPWGGSTRGGTSKGLRTTRTLYHDRGYISLAQDGLPQENNRGCPSCINFKEEKFSTSCNLQRYATSLGPLLLQRRGRLLEEYHRDNFNETKVQKISASMTTNPLQGVDRED